MNVNWKIIYILLLLAVMRSSLFGAFVRKGAGVPFLAGGGSGIACPLTTYALFNNPALISFKNSFQVNATSRNFYQIKDLNQINLHAIISLFNTPLAIGLQRYGNNLYSETEIRAGINYPFSKNFSMGISLNYYSLYIERYLTAYSFSFDLGIKYDLSDNFSLGTVVTNLNEPQIGSAEERLPKYFSLGICYTPLEQIYLALDIVKEDKFDFDYRFGIHYIINNWLTIHSGFREMTDLFTVGFSLSVNKFTGGYALEYHPILNLSQGFEIQYVF